MIIYLVILMNYDKLVYDTYKKIFQDNEIKNNDYIFLFLSCKNNFYKFAKNYYNIMAVGVSKDIIQLSILFEYLYINQVYFFEIYNNNVNNECLDLLTFLHANINITKNINLILKKLECYEFIIDILNTIKYTDFINKSDYNENKIHRALIDIFYKIISR